MSKSEKAFAVVLIVGGLAFAIWGASFFGRAVPLPNPGNKNDTNKASQAIDTRQAGLPERGGIQGRVLDMDGKPVQGAVIASSYTLNKERKPGGSATTAAEGTFVIPNLEPSVYEVVIRKEGFAHTSISGVHVRPGAPVNIGDLQLQRVAGYIEAVILDAASGAPIGGAEVRIVKPARQGPPTEIFVSKSAETGVVRIPGLADGGYFIQVSKDGYSRDNIQFSVQQGKVTNHPQGLLQIKLIKHR